MPEPLQDLVDQTRRLSRPRPDAASVTSRRRRGEKTLTSARRSGGLPEPRIVEPESLPEPPASDLFGDFNTFGDRIADLMTETQARHKRTRRCTPFTTTRDSHVTHRRRKRKPTTGTEAREAASSPSTDATAVRLAAVGIAVLSAFAIAAIAVSAPRESERSSPIARTPVTPQPAAELDLNAEPKLAGSVDEPRAD